MKQLLKEAREKLLELTHNKTISQSEINRLFNQLENEYSSTHDINSNNNAYFSDCKCCGRSYKSGEISNEICDECNLEINRIRRNKIVKKYIKGGK